MRKVIAASAASLAYLLTTVKVFATGPLDLNFSNIKQGVNPNASPSDLITAALTIAFAAAAILVLFFLVLGAFNWITSGGDKEKVGNARKIIINALIGFVILALAFFIVRVVGDIIHIDIFNQGSIPTLPAAQ